MAVDRTSQEKLPRRSPVDEDARTALERKERVRRALLKIKTPERRREVLRVAIEYARLMQRLRVGKKRSANAAPLTVKPPK